MYNSGQDKSSDSAHAQHWWPQGSQEKAGGERGKFEAALRFTQASHQ